jgi:cytochrome P450
VNPEELSFTDPSAYQDIFMKRQGQYPLPKDPVFYTKMPNGAWPISSAPVKDHLRMRKQLNYAFSDKALSEQEPLIQRHVNLLMEKLGGLAATHEAKADNVDMTSWFNYTVFDIFGEFGFGESFGCLQEGRYHQWTRLLFSMPKHGMLRIASSYYTIFTPFLLYFFPPALVRQLKDHWQLCIDRVQSRIALGAKVESKDLLSYILRNEDTAQAMTIPEMEATGYILIFAGAETTSSVLSAAFCYLTHHPDKMRKLAAEVRQAFQARDEIKFRSTAGLPYLNAVIQETMRLAPPVTGGGARVVDTDGYTICGQPVPKGVCNRFCSLVSVANNPTQLKTVVGIPSYSSFRSSDNFIYPTHFLPERWLNSDSSLLAPTGADPKFNSSTFSNDKKSALQPFSTGPRNCIGLNLAWAEMRLILATCLWEFDVLPPRNPGDMIIWEEQKTYNNWERVAMNVRLVKAKAEQIAETL